MASTPAVAFWLVCFWLVTHRTWAHGWRDLVPADTSRRQRWSTVWLIASILSIGTWCVMTGWNGPDSVPREIAGSALAAAGFVLVLHARRTLGRHFSIHLQVDVGHELITGGPYGVLRHPTYSGDILFYSGIVVITGAWWGFVLVAVFSALAVVRSRREEKMLAAAYPDYAEYMTRTHALVPGVY